VEFGDEEVARYDRQRARALTAWLDTASPLVFEAHSTDYQNVDSLNDLVVDGFAILKVGPWLTFALRETLYGLDRIAGELYPEERSESLQTTMERVMRGRPEHWQRYYMGSATERRVKRHFSYSDRIRYYWADPDASRAVARLLELLGETALPVTLVSQCLNGLSADVAAGRLQSTARALLAASVRSVIEKYAAATRTPTFGT
jgi:D-tagatose-1,6-bisphosphate aldolase subunit GatZ/KbaZ